MTSFPGLCDHRTGVDATSLTVFERGLPVVEKLAKSFPANRKGTRKCHRGAEKSRRSVGAEAASFRRIEHWIATGGLDHYISRPKAYLSVKAQWASHTCWGVSFALLPLYSATNGAATGN